jgi:hypothetical protein|uniref:Uncharacterized protein n=1 Tax=Myoviridae sp. ctsip2 TaxID=2826705 RepID=A0A8S5N650_9CAUD|nr:MAG TPA: Protein of unknown function (DUF2612) [Myoviridae sp. ctsip2]
MPDYTQDIEDVKNYYADLLILQYRNKPKARETIKIGADIYLGDGVIFQLQDILDIDTAEGAQLDIIGKILDCPRVVQGVYNDMIFFQFYDGEDSVGFSTVGNPQGGNFRTIQNYNQSEYSLPDDDYRFLLKFKSAVNVMRGSERGIDDALWNVFQGDVLLKNNHNLTITYIVSAERTLAALAAKQLGYYRAPEGVGANYVLRVPSPSQIFGFNRKGIINKTVVGFSTKDKRQTGTWLTKENLISLVTPEG